MIISDMVGIVADDLTEANEAALQFHLRGANSQILLDFEQGSTRNVKNTQVWAVSTATRNQDPVFAHDEVVKATKYFLDNLSLDYFFKKISSTLNGNKESSVQMGCGPYDVHVCGQRVNMHSQTYKGRARRE